MRLSIIVFAALAIAAVIGIRHAGRVQPSVEVVRSGAPSTPRPTPSRERSAPSVAPQARPARSVDEKQRLAESAPLPRTLRDFPNSPEVRRGWQAVRRNDIFGFGEQFDLAYLGSLADLQECTRSQIQTRGPVHLTVTYDLLQGSSGWTAVLRSVDPFDSTLTPDEDSIVLACARQGIGKSIPLDDNKTNRSSIIDHWHIAFPLRDSRIYQKILGGGTAY